MTLLRSLRVCAKGCLFQALPTMSECNLRGEPNERSTREKRDYGSRLLRESPYDVAIVTVREINSEIFQLFTNHKRCRNGLVEQATRQHYTACDLPFAKH